MKVIFYCKTITSYNSIIKRVIPFLKIWVNFLNISRAFFYFLNKQNIKSTSWIILLKYFPILFSWWVFYSVPAKNSFLIHFFFLKVAHTIYRKNNCFRKKLFYFSFIFTSVSFNFIKSFSNSKRIFFHFKEPCHLQIAYIFLLITVVFLFGCFKLIKLFKAKNIKCNVNQVVFEWFQVILIFCFIYKLISWSCKFWGQYKVLILIF